MRPVFAMTSIAASVELQPEPRAARLFDNDRLRSDKQILIINRFDHKNRTLD